MPAGMGLTRVTLELSSAAVKHRVGHLQEARTDCSQEDMTLKSGLAVRMMGALGRAGMCVAAAAVAEVARVLLAYA